MRKGIYYFIVGILILLVILYAFGFRITYAPELENSWDAISACAGWFGAIMSALALFVAIHIPKRIADQQDRIALFDKRFYAFSKLTFLLPVAREIIDNTSKDEAEQLDPWKILASGMQAYKYTNNPFDAEINFQTVKYFYSNLVLEAVKIELLFKNENTEDIVSFLKTLDSYATNVCSGDPFDKEQNTLQTIVKKIDDSKILDKLEEYLAI